MHLFRKKDPAAMDALLLVYDELVAMDTELPPAHLLRERVHTLRWQTRDAIFALQGRLTTSLFRPLGATEQEGA